MRPLPPLRSKRGAHAAGQGVCCYEGPLASQELQGSAGASQERGGQRREAEPGHGEPGDRTHCCQQGPPRPPQDLQGPRAHQRVHVEPLPRGGDSAGAAAAGAAAAGAAAAQAFAEAARALPHPRRRRGPLAAAAAAALRCCGEKTRKKDAGSPPNEPKPLLLLLLLLLLQRARVQPRGTRRQALQTCALLQRLLRQRLQQLLLQRLLRQRLQQLLLENSLWV